MDLGKQRSRRSGWSEAVQRIDMDRESKTRGEG